MVADDTNRTASLGFRGGHEPALGDGEIAGDHKLLGRAEDRYVVGVPFLELDALLGIGHGTDGAGQSELFRERFDLIEGDGPALLHLHPFFMSVDEPVEALDVKHVRSNERNTF